MFNLALRNVFRHGGRTTITLGAIIAGVMALILTGGFVRDLFTQLGEAVIHSQSGHLQISKAGFQVYGSRKPEQYVIADPDPIVARVKAIPGVVDVMTRVAFSGLLNNGRSDAAITGEGIEPEKESRLGSYLLMVAGRRLEAHDREGAMLGEGVAHALRLRPGDHATLLVSAHAGAINTLDLDIVGVFRTFSKDYDAHTIKIPLSAAREVLDSRGVNTLVVSLASTSGTSRIAGELRSLFAGANLEVWTWQELNDFYAKVVQLYERQFGVLQLIILLLVLLSVANNVNMSLFERIPEFGTMRALGDRAGRVVRLILLETLLLGLIGSILGAILGGVVSVGISLVGIPMPPPPNAELGYTARIPFVPDVAMAAVFIGVVATALAGIPAALRAARIPVVNALRQAI